MENQVGQNKSHRAIPISIMVAAVIVTVIFVYLSNILPFGDPCSAIADASLGPPYTKRTECYFKLAIDRKNPKLCFKIGGRVTNPYKDDMAVYCVENYVTATNSAAACDLLSGYYDGDEVARCQQQLKDYNLVGKYEHNWDMNSTVRQAGLEHGRTMQMQEAADQKFADTSFKWTIAFHLTDERAQYSNKCGSQGYMVATMSDRAPWDALSQSDKTAVVTKLMIYVYGDFGSRKDVRVYFGAKLLAQGNDLGCGSKPLRDEVQILE